MEHPEHTPEDAWNTVDMVQQVRKHPKAAIQQIQELNAQLDSLRAQNNTPSSLIPTPPPPTTLSAETLSVLSHLMT